MKKILSLVLSALLVLGTAGCSGTKSETFTGTAKGYGGDVSVSVTFKDDKITKVEAKGDQETDGIGSKAIAELPSKIVEANGPDVDVVAGATVTSNAIINATKKAIRMKNGDTSLNVSYTPGTYEGTAKGYKSEIKVSVEVDESSIKSIKVLEHGDTYGIAHGMDTTAIEVMPSKIVETQGLGVDTVTGATVTSNAVIEAVANALTNSGADTSILREIKQVSNPSEVTYNVDVVVVGAGSTGLSAAIEAARNGAKVLLVEKQSIIGGAATRSGGKLLAAGTDVQKKAGIKDSAEKMCAYLKGVGKEYINEEMIDDFCENSLEVYNWMVDLGVKVQDVEPIHSSIDTHRVHNTLGGGGMTSGHGGQITVPLYNEFKKTGAEIIYDTAINEIRMSGNEVIGVSGVKKDGSKVVVNAKSVILATGGYAANKEMVRSYGKEFPFYAASVPASNTGDGITMADKVGAQIFDNPAVQVVFLDFGSGVGINEEAGLILSQEGKRVANEFTYQYHVGDALAKAGSTHGWYIATANDKTPTVQYAMTLDSTLKASSIEELAKLMGVDSKVLKETVDRYNTLAKKGKDDDFNKPSKYMYPIEGETYYALKLMPSVTVTYSGIVTNTNAEVLDDNNNPIKGLYAAGETAFPGLFGTEYPGCGMAISSGAYYGRVAGANAAKLSK